MQPHHHHRKLVLDVADGTVVGYNHPITGRVHPVDQVVQLLVLSKDDRWYLQKEAVVNANGTFKVESVFGVPSSVHEFTIVAIAGRVVHTPYVDQIPNARTSRSVLVRRAV